MLAWFTDLVNGLFGGAVTWLLIRLGLSPAHPEHPIPAYFAGEILVLLIILAGAIVLRRRLSVESPGKLQHAMEALFSFTQGMADEVIGPGARRYVPLIGTLGIFIVLCNLLGLIPTLDTPTAHIEVTLGCAVIVFVHYNWHGFRHHGVLGYLRHLGGPILAVAWLMLPIEVFSNFLRMLSLSVRLWANMMAGGRLESVFTSLVPIALPSVFMALHVFESFLQAYIFMILPAVYISLAIAEEH